MQYSQVSASTNGVEVASSFATNYQGITDALIRYGASKLSLITLCSPNILHPHSSAPCKHPGKVPLEGMWQKFAGAEMDQARYRILAQHPYNFGLPIPHYLVALDPDCG